MRQAIAQPINNCDSCQTKKYDRRPNKIIYSLTETPERPMEIVHIDLYFINKKSVLTIIDKISRYAWGLTIPAKESVNIVKAVKSFMALFGVPKKIICDQGVEFTSNLFKDFCRQYELELHTTSFQQSSSNSTVERLHSTITEIYRLINETRKKNKLESKHEEVLDEAFITYNNAIHSATKLTPQELFTGRTHNFLNTVSFNNEHEYLQKINAFQAELYPKIKERVQQEKNKRIEAANVDRQNPVTVQPGDIIFRKENRRDKLTPRFSKHKVMGDNGLTLTFTKPQKIHKEKIRRLTKPNEQ